MIFYRVRVQGYTGIDRHRLWPSGQILQGIFNFKAFWIHLSVMEASHVTKIGFDPSEIRVKVEQNEVFII